MLDDGATVEHLSKSSTKLTRAYSRYEATESVS